MLMDLKKGLTVQSKNLLKKSQGKLLLAVALPVLLAACSSTPEVVVETKYIKQHIPLQEQPGKVNFPPVDWYVVTEDNIEEFLARLEDDTGHRVFFAISPKSYENLAIGIADLRRFIKEQKGVVVYYEEALTADEVEEVNEAE